MNPSLSSALEQLRELAKTNWVINIVGHEGMGKRTIVKAFAGSNYNEVCYWDLDDGQDDVEHDKRQEHYGGLMASAKSFLLIVRCVGRVDRIPTFLQDAADDAQNFTIILLHTERPEKLLAFPGQEGVVVSVNGVAPTVEDFKLIGLSEEWFPAAEVVYAQLEMYAQAVDPARSPQIPLEFFHRAVKSNIILKRIWYASKFDYTKLPEILDSAGALTKLILDAIQIKPVEEILPEIFSPQTDSREPLEWKASTTLGEVCRIMCTSFVDFVKHKE